MNILSGYPSVNAFSDVFTPTAAYTCEEWGNLGIPGIPVLISSLDMYFWFMTDGFPEFVILDQDMKVFDYPPNLDIDYIINKIQEALDNCPQCETGGIIGDINGDSTISVLDIILVVNIILEISNPTPEQEGLADINSDGAVTVTDVILLVNNILGN